MPIYRNHQEFLKAADAWKTYDPAEDEVDCMCDEDPCVCGDDDDNYCPPDPSDEIADWVDWV